MKKLSTDAKLANIIHGHIDDPAEREEELRRQEKLAKQRLRRACLYGGGARTKVPKIKIPKKHSTSPFRLADFQEDELPPCPLTNSEPPNAHNDLYRIVQ
jgi:hypothetical protein